MKDIKIIEKNGMNIILDVNSGSIHIFDELSKNTLKKYVNNEDIIDIDELNAFEEINTLINEGSLLSKDSGELPKAVNKSLKSICLNVAHICNLACPYCFASGGSYKGNEALMSLDVGKKAIDFLFEKSIGRKIVEVDFFGGEPLLNFQLIKDVVTYGEEKAKESNKSIKWSMTTNGVLLDKNACEFLKEHNVGTVLSIDGRKEIHDKYRYFKDKSGSYDKIVKNYQRFKEYSDDYVARGTYTKGNLDFYNDIEVLKELGFEHLSMEPVIGGDLTYEDLQTIRESYDILAEKYLNWLSEDKPLDFFHFNINLKGGPCIYKRITACGAGFEYLAITPIGDIFPCHQLIENKDYRLGNIMTDTFNDEISEVFQDINIYTKEKCSNCWARFYCSGGCHSNNLKYGGDLSNPDNLSCDLQKIRLESAIYVQAQKLLREYSKNNFKTSDEITKEKIIDMLK